MHTPAEGALRVRCHHPVRATGGNVLHRTLCQPPGEKVYSMPQKVGVRAEPEASGARRQRGCPVPHPLRVEKVYSIPHQGAHA